MTGDSSKKRVLGARRPVPHLPTGSTLHVAEAHPGGARASGASACGPETFQGRGAAGAPTARSQRGEARSRGAGVRHAGARVQVCAGVKESAGLGQRLAGARGVGGCAGATVRARSGREGCGAPGGVVETGGVVKSRTLRIQSISIQFTYNAITQIFALQVGPRAGLRPARFIFHRGLRLCLHVCRPLPQKW